MICMNTFIFKCVRYLLKCCFPRNKYGYSPKYNYMVIRAKTISQLIGKLIDRKLTVSVD